MEPSRRCPTCRALVRWDSNPHRPFCSERCRLADLGGWVTEQYRIPGRPLGADMLDEDDESDPA